MNIDQIRTAIQQDPVLLALANSENPNTEQIAAGIPPEIKIRSEYVTERGVVATLGMIDGEEFLVALENFVGSVLPADHILKPYQPGIARQLAWLKTQGIDVGSAPARQLLDTLAYVGVIDPTHAASIKSLAEESIPVSEFDVRRAIWNDDGTRAI